MWLSRWSRQLRFIFGLGNKEGVVCCFVVLRVAGLLILKVYVRSMLIVDSVSFSSFTTKLDFSSLLIQPNNWIYYTTIATMKWILDIIFNNFRHQVILIQAWITPSRFLIFTICNRSISRVIIFIYSLSYKSSLPLIWSQLLVTYITNQNLPNHLYKNLLPIFGFASRNVIYTLTLL